MNYRIRVTIDNHALTEAYDNEVGSVEKYDDKDQLIERRPATDAEALGEQWCRRIEQALRGHNE